jgi:hypothetical protein
MVRFELNNGGAIIPVVAGSEANIQDSFDFAARAPGGSISGTVIGNDQTLYKTLSIQAEGE